MRKLNLHLCIDGEALSFCRAVNAEIRAITESVIVFDDKSPMIPHVSLIMGELLDKEDISRVEVVARKIAEDTGPISFEIKSPYLENVRNRYVFADLRNGQDFEQLKTRLHKDLAGSVLQTQTDYAPQPHLTLAHVEAQREAVAAYLRSVHPSFTFTCNVMGLSDVGPKGTCINSLMRFGLGEH